MHTEEEVTDVGVSATATSKGVITAALLKPVKQQFQGEEAYFGP